jgi:hypothetical protein
MKRNGIEFDPQQSTIISVIEETNLGQRYALVMDFKPKIQLYLRCKIQIVKSEREINKDYIRFKCFIERETRYIVFVPNNIDDPYVE